MLSYSFYANLNYFTIDNNFSFSKYMHLPKNESTSKTRVNDEIN